MTLHKILDFSPPEVCSEPFQYFVSARVLSDRVSLMVLDWFETDAPWKLVETDFYEQYEFSLWDVQMPSHLAFLRDPLWIPTPIHAVILVHVLTTGAGFNVDTLPALCEAAVDVKCVIRGGYSPQTH